MLYIKDKSDEVWAMLSADTSVIKYEDGTQKNLTTKDLVIEMGKHKGRLLSEIKSVSYLKWMGKTAVEKDLQFVVKCVKLRLLELKQ